MKDKPSEYLHIKIKLSREFMGVSQGYIQRNSGVPQSRISQYETRVMDAIPSVYLEYLASNGINMSALFNPAITPDQYMSILKKNDPGSVVRTEVGACSNCSSKEVEIALLKSLIQAKDDLIAQFRR